MTEAQIITVASTVGSVAVSVGIGIGILKSSINGHMKNKDIHMTAKEKAEIAVSAEKIDSNEDFIRDLKSDMALHEQNVREDLGIIRKDLGRGLDRIHKLIKNGNN